MEGKFMNMWKVRFWPQKLIGQIIKKREIKKNETSENGNTTYYMYEMQKYVVFERRDYSCK